MAKATAFKGKIPDIKLDPKCQLFTDCPRQAGKNDSAISIIFNKNQTDFINEAITVLGDYAYIKMMNCIVIDLRNKEVNAVYKRQREEFEKKLKRSNEKARQASAYVRKIQSERKRK